jgi:hypothetical protein
MHRIRQTQTTEEAARRRPRQQLACGSFFTQRHEPRSVGMAAITSTTGGGPHLAQTGPRNRSARAQIQPASRSMMGWCFRRVDGGAPTLGSDPNTSPGRSLFLTELTYLAPALVARRSYSAAIVRLAAFAPGSSSWVTTSRASWEFPGLLRRLDMLFPGVLTEFSQHMDEQTLRVELADLRKFHDFQCDLICPGSSRQHSSRRTSQTRRKAARMASIRSRSTSNFENGMAALCWRVRSRPPAGLHQH